jgi:hypothetical protein
MIRYRPRPSIDTEQAGFEHRRLFARIGRFSDLAHDLARARIDFKDRRGHRRQLRVAGAQEQAHVVVELHAGTEIGVGNSEEFDLPFERQVVAEDFLVRQSPLHGLIQYFQFERLDQEIVRSPLENRDRGFDRRMRGHEHHDGVRIVLQRRFHNLKPRPLAHHKVGEDEVHRIGRQIVHRPGGLAESDNVVIRLTQRFDDNLADVFFVVDDQYPAFAVANHGCPFLCSGRSSYRPVGLTAQGPVPVCPIIALLYGRLLAAHPSGPSGLFLNEAVNGAAFA